MSSFKAALPIGFTALALGLGCDKGQSTSSGTSSSSSSSPTPTTVTPAAAETATAMTELAATYNAVSDVDGSSMKRKQALVLKADGTVELDTTEVDPAKPTAAPHSSDQATGTYIASAKEVVATFTMKDGKAIPTSDKNHTMKLTRGKGDKSLLDESGRTFERAK